jgi:hypothetical protein
MAVCIEEKVVLNISLFCNDDKYGKSLEYVGIYFPKQVFTHGQLYVAVSRVTCRDALKDLMFQWRIPTKWYEKKYCVQRDTSLQENLEYLYCTLCNTQVCTLICFLSSNIINFISLLPYAEALVNIFLRPIGSQRHCWSAAWRQGCNQHDLNYRYVYLWFLSMYGIQRSNRVVV